MWKKRQAAAHNTANSEQQSKIYWHWLKLRVTMATLWKGLYLHEVWVTIYRSWKRIVISDLRTCDVIHILAWILQAYFLFVKVRFTEVLPFLCRSTQSELFQRGRVSDGSQPPWHCSSPRGQRCCYTGHCMRTQSAVSSNQANSFPQIPPSRLWTPVSKAVFKQNEAAHSHTSDSRQVARSHVSPSVLKVVVFRSGVPELIIKDSFVQCSLTVILHWRISRTCLALASVSGRRKHCCSCCRVSWIRWRRAEWKYPVFMRSIHDIRNSIMKVFWNVVFMMLDLCPIYVYIVYQK